jgi:hypothetical protein
MESNSRNKYNKVFREAGISTEDVAEQEREDLLKALLASQGKDVADVTQDESEDVIENPLGTQVRTRAETSRMNNGMDEQEAVRAAIAASLSEADVQSSAMDAIIPKQLDLINMRRVVTDEGCAIVEQCVDIPSLHAFWRDLVSELAIYGQYERTRYSQLIQSAVKELSNEIRNGVLIAVLLPNGARIARTFDKSVCGKDVYIWCAGDERMVRDMIKPGTFVIIFANGKAIRPARALGEQIQGNRILLNTRLF